MTACERDECTELGRDYFITGGVVHVNLPHGVTDIYTGRGGCGWISLCAQHALRDLGVAIA